MSDHNDTIVALLALPASKRTRSVVEAALPASFAQTHPSLLAMLCDPTMDVGIMANLLRLSGAVRDGEIDQHDASVEVGQVLVDTFVKPHVKKE